MIVKIVCQVISAKTTRISAVAKLIPDHAAQALCFCFCPGSGYPEILFHMLINNMQDTTSVLETSEAQGWKLVLYTNETVNIAPGSPNVQDGVF